MPHRFVTLPTNGIRLRAVVEGSGPLVVLVHGFPEGWYSWRHQIGPIAAAGFTACAIDVRGYGGSPICRRSRRAPLWSPTGACRRRWL
jgi:pimeloyl-ACP methyl ester carboxylesterase